MSARTSGAINAELSSNAANAEVLNARKRELNASAERLTRALAEVLSAGRTDDQTRRALRDVRDELEIVAASLARNASERESLDAELAEARRREARDNANVALRDALAALERVDAPLREFARDVLPLCEEAHALIEVADAAEREAATIRGERFFGDTRVVVEGWQRRPGLYALFEALRTYARRQQA